MTGSPSERDLIFSNAKAIADTMVETFGRHCEIVIHDLSDPSHSVVHVAGTVTNRQVGAPVTDLGLRMLREAKDGMDRVCGWRNALKDGRTLKSSVSFLRDSTGEIIGLFCVNFDITEFLDSMALVGEMIRTRGELGGSEDKESFSLTVNETIASISEQAITEIGKQPATMTTEDKIQVVRNAERRGLFLIKGAIDYIADRLSISKFTVYNYLQKIRAGKQFGTATETDGLP